MKAPVAPQKVIFIINVSENKEMPSIELIKDVVLSWQVIAVTFAFVVYWSMVSAIVRPPHKRAPAVKKIKRIKRPPEKKPLDNDTDTDDLGLD
jgi:flagellar biosynthesis/type III secretory pathway M-ring protein FliF/YscJ